jgi:hypothetical protein
MAALIVLSLLLAAPIVALLIARKHGDVEIKFFGLLIKAKRDADDKDEKPKQLGG